MASTQLSANVLTERRIGWAAGLSLTGITYFVLAIVALHFLRPDLDPIRYPTSAYAVGQYGWLMTSAFFSASVAWFALVRGLARGVTQQARSRIGLGFLSLWAAGVLVAMTFPMDAPGAPPTVAGIIHESTGPLAFLFLSLGMILVSWQFRQNVFWLPLHPAALTLSLIFLAAYLAMVVTFSLGTGLLGIFQRVALTTMVVWLACVALRLRSVHK